MSPRKYFFNISVTEFFYCWVTAVNIQDILKQRRRNRPCMDAWNRVVTVCKIVELSVMLMCTGLRFDTKWNWKEWLWSWPFTSLFASFSYYICLICCRISLLFISVSISGFVCVFRPVCDWLSVCNKLCMFFCFFKFEKLFFLKSCIFLVCFTINHVHKAKKSFTRINMTVHHEDHVVQCLPNFFFEHP